MTAVPITPPRLRAGDTVAVCAPAGPVPADRLRAGLDVLSQSFRVRVADDITRASGYLAGSDERRADELNAALRDTDVRAIWLARGGYGLMRILDRLDSDALRRDPIPIVGFSDGTALLAWARAAGVRPIHGPVVCQLGEIESEDRSFCAQLLQGQVGAGATISGLSALGAAASEPMRGPLLGGNLSLLAHLVATPVHAPLAGAIVALEDVGERPYAIDRYLTRLYMAGAFDGARAIACGDFVRCDEPTEAPHPSPLEVVGERLVAFGLPGAAGLPIGHGRRNRAWSFGGQVELDLASGTLMALEAAVE